MGVMIGVFIRDGGAAADIEYGCRHVACGVRGFPTAIFDRIECIERASRAVLYGGCSDGVGAGMIEYLGPIVVVVEGCLIGGLCRIKRYIGGTGLERDHEYRCRVYYLTIHMYYNDSYCL